MFNKALIIGILLFGATFSISANEVQKWEYGCVDTYLTHSVASEQDQAAVLAKKFNKLGEEGWEMVGYAMSDALDEEDEARMVCFKRPKKS